MKRILFLFLFIILGGYNYAQFNDYNPDYNWFTIHGKYVRVHYHPEAERTARIVCKIADEIWEPITSLYQYEPETIDFVIKDIDDYSNGATYFFDNKIEIWSSSLDFDLRGTHNWLRNVISHEFTHMVQIQASLKTVRSIPAVYLQFLNYEDKRRPDILYGFPNFVASYPVAFINIPSWFAEGTAQYMRKEFGYEDWDSHRDMILRSYALENKLLTWNEMGVFGKTSLGNESVYNSGFALTRYIAQKYGEDKLRTVSQKLGKLTNFTIDAAFEDALGKTGTEVYDEWSGFLKADYKKRIADVETNKVTGQLVVNEGFGNFYPTFSSKGDKFLYVSNKSFDYMSLSSVYLYDLNTKTEKNIAFGVRSTVGFIPGTNKIIYAKLSDDNPKWTDIHDLYVYDIDTEDETRLTFGLRANNPSVSHDGNKIVFIYQNDGTVNIGTVDIDGKNFRRLTFFEKGEQLFNPKFSQDNSFILFDYSIKNNRDICRINVDGSNLEFITTSEADERNPVQAKDGNVYFSSNETGIFNLYFMNPADKNKTQITNVVGGAFMPDVNENGDVVYAGYTSDGYKIFLLDKIEQAKVDPNKKYVWINNPPLDSDKPNGDINNFDIAGLKNYDDNKTPDYTPEKYSGFFSNISIYPFVRFDNYNTSSSSWDRIKPGIYFSSSDVLNRFSIFGSASINKIWERDLYFLLEYRDKLPLINKIGIKPELGVELFSVSRNSNIDIDFGIDSTFIPPRIDYTVPAEVSYNLFEFDIFAKHKIFTKGNTLEARFIFSQYTSTLGSFVIPESDNALYPTTNDKYFVGRNVQLKFEHDGIIPAVDSDINPLGRTIEFQYNYEFNRFNNDNEYQIVDGSLVPLYNNFNFHRLELNWKEHFSVGKNKTLTARFRAGSILGPDVPDFFDFYLGGIIGMKSYPFYAVSGNEVGWLNLTYRFPLLTDIDAKFGHLYIDKIYMSVYGDIGNAWNGSVPSIKTFKKGAGAELRVKMVSFYIFPTSLFINASYSFDKISRIIRGENVTYGKEFQFYGGILFDFSF